MSDVEWIMNYLRDNGELNSMTQDFISWCIKMEYRYLLLLQAEACKKTEAVVLSVDDVLLWIGKRLQPRAHENFKQVFAAHTQYFIDRHSAKTYR